MRLVKKGIAAMAAVSLLAGLAVGSPEAEAAKKVKAKSISLSCAKKTLTVGKSLMLKAKVKPKKAKAKINWTTSNKKVATVSAKGKVTAKKKGVAKITAAVKGTKLKKTCKITVKAKDIAPIPLPNAQNTVTAAPVPNAGQNAPAVPVQNAGQNTAAPSVPTAASIPTATPAPTATPVPEDIRMITKQSEVEAVLDDAKSDAKVKKVMISTDAAESFELPEGSYPELELVIEAPNAEVSNHALFKRVTINAIAKDTYKEYAEGNKIDANCLIGRIVFTDRSLAELNVLKDAANLSVVVDGSVSGINVNAADSVIDISGSTREPIPVNVQKEAEIASSSLLNVTASAKVTYVLYPGAEDSEFFVDNSDLIPKVYGIGSIKVNIKDSEDVQTIIAEFRDDVSGDQQMVSFEGAIVDYDTDAGIEGATVYLVPYTNNFDETKVEENDYLKTSVTDANGNYKIDSIHTGNYIMVVKEEGMVTAIQYVIITSRYGSEFRNETLRLFPQTEGNEPGTITGILSNSVDGNPIAGLTARLRKGKGNTEGSVLTKTVSDDKGSYTFEDVEPGYYTVEFVDLRNGQASEKYITTSMNAIVRSGKTDTVSTALTASVSLSQIRFVLTWGDETSGAPSDLDSHLLGPTKSDTGRFHTYFADESYVEDDVHYADLDHDDVTWEGPETSTIYEPVAGTYDFYIHNFSDRHETKSSTLATSGAKVEVYQGTTLLVTYYVPNQEGTLWHVCSYDSATNTLTQKDEMTYEEETENVGTDPRQRAMDSLKKYVESMNRILDSMKDNDAKAALKQKVDGYAAFAQTDPADHAVQEIQDKANELSDLISAVQTEVGITDIEFEDGDSYAEINNSESIVTIYTFDPASAAVAQISLSEGATSKLVKAEDGSLTAIEVTSANGYVRSYSVVYEIPAKYFYINKVEGTNIGSWDTDYVYDEDNKRIDVLKIYTTDGKNSDFTVVPEYADRVKVSYEKDENGKITGVTLTVGNATKTYRVDYEFDTSLLVPDNLVSEEIDEWEWDSVYDENDEIYYVLNIWTVTGESCDFTVTPKTEAVSVQCEKDGTGAIQSVTLSAGENARTYKVNYKLPSKYFYINEITGDAVTDWDTDSDVLTICTRDGKSSEFTLVPEYPDKAQVSYKKDDAGKITGVDIVVGSVTKTYTVEYTFDMNQLVPGGVSGDSVEDWDYDWDYDDNDERYYTLEVWTETGESCDFTVTPKRDDIQVDYVKSDGVIQSVTLSSGEYSRTYTVKFYQW